MQAGRVGVTLVKSEMFNVVERCALLQVDAWIQKWQLLRRCLG
jgi:hypothetical protein